MNDHLKKAQRKASSPEARAKAAATMKRRNAEKKALLAQTQHPDEIPPAHMASMSLDAIPDREPKRKYNKKVKVEIEQQFIVTEKEYMFLKMAKMLLGGK